MTDVSTNSDYFGYDVLPPVEEDYDSYESYLAARDAWYSGFQSYARRQQEESEAAQLAAVEEAARLAREEEEARRRAEEEEAARQAREEEEVRAAQEVEQLTGDDPDISDRYQIGSYVDAAGNVWSQTGELLTRDEGLADSYVDQAGHLWQMQYSGSAESQTFAEGEIAAGDSTIDTALLLLDLIDALTGEEGMSSDVDTLQDEAGSIRQILDHPLMTTSFQDYTVTEGLLLLLLLSVFMAACAKMLKEGFAWLR